MVNQNKKSGHISVMAGEVIAEFIDLKDDKISIVALDLTLGGGGHAAEMYSKILDSKYNNSSTVLGLLDQDSNAYPRFQEKIDAAGKFQVEFWQQNFADLSETIAGLARYQQLDFVLADLGPSQCQIDSVAGMSYKKNSDLDMRLDSSLAPTAADLLKVFSAKQLANLFSEYAQLKQAKKFANEIVARRKAGQIIETTTQLNQLVKASLGEKFIPKIYQALRMAVNLEVVNLQKMLKFVTPKLSRIGKLLVITFHSGEQREIVRYVKSSQVTENKLANRIVKPSQAEVSQNPRSRSAILNVITPL